MSLKPKKTKSGHGKKRRSKSLTPSLKHNIRSCKYRHPLKLIDTVSNNIQCEDCRRKLRKYATVYGCQRCRFYLCCICHKTPACTNGHLLSASHVGKGALCGSCGYESKRRLQMYHCQACKYYLCLGCYSSETCNGNHHLKYTKIKNETNKKNRYCHKCQRIYKTNHSLFMCSICKFSLCGECYQPTLHMKQKIHRQKKLQKISSRIRTMNIANTNNTANTFTNNTANTFTNNTANTSANNTVNQRQKPRLKKRSNSTNNNNDTKPPHTKTQSNSLLNNSRTSSHHSHHSHQSGRSHSQIRVNTVNNQQSLVHIQSLVKQRNNSSSDNSTTNNSNANRGLLQSITYSNFNEFSNENNNNTNFDAVNLEDLSSILQDLQSQNNLNINVSGAGGNSAFIQQSPNVEENILLDIKEDDDSKQSEITPLLTDDMVQSHNAYYRRPQSFSNYNILHHSPHTHIHTQSNMSAGVMDSTHSTASNSTCATLSSHTAPYNRIDGIEYPYVYGSTFSENDLATPSELTRIPSLFTECCVCMERDKSVAFLPCGHYICCDICANALKNDRGECAICQSKIVSIVRIYE